MKKSVRPLITAAILLLASISAAFAQTQTQVQAQIHTQIQAALQAPTAELPLSDSTTISSTQTHSSDQTFSPERFHAILPGPDYHLSNAIIARSAITFSINRTAAINRSISQSLAGTSTAKTKRSTPQLLNTGPFKISVKTKTADSFVRQMLRLFPDNPEMQQFITARYAKLPKRAYFITLKLTF